MASASARTRSPAGRTGRALGCRGVVTSQLSSLARRAGAAQPAVAAIDLDGRLDRLAEARDRVAAVADRLVDAAVAEVGTPRRFAHREVVSALDLLDALPGLADAIRPRPVPARSGTTMLEWAPYGVVLGWHAANSPLWVPTLVVASALAGGNTVLSRPSQRTRTTTGLLLEALAGPWPTGAVLMVDLPGPQAEPLVWHEGVHAVVAHAGTETCKRQIAALGHAYLDGARMRPYIPEGAGNDAAIIRPGADLNRAAAAVAVGGFANAGQLCMSAKRIIVEREVWPEFRPLLAAAVERLVVGLADDPATDIAPLREGTARARARDALAEALAAGGRVVVGEGERGAHFTPTVLELPVTARTVTLWRTESFAPLRGLIVVDGPDEAVELANDTAYGLGAAVFGPADDLVGRLRAARVMVDEGPLYQDPHMVVGGVDDSGMAGARPKIEQLVFARRVHRADAGRPHGD